MAKETSFDTLFGPLVQQGYIAPPSARKQPFGVVTGTPTGQRPAVPLRAVPSTHPGKGQAFPGPAGTPPIPPTPPGGTPPPPPPESLGIPGLPPDVAANVAQILASDPQNGVSRALAYIRGTPWYAQTYPGINAGIQAGVIHAGPGQESEYRNWHTQVNDTYNRYYGRSPTSGELLGYLGRGFAPADIEQIGRGHAWVGANQPEAQWAFGAADTGPLTDQQLQTLGEQNAGRTSTLGETLNTRFQKAMQKMQVLFSGTLATPRLGTTAAGVNAPDLLGTKARPDIGT